MTVQAEQLSGLLRRRWAETCHALGIGLDQIDLTWRVGANTSYPHFRTRRGYAVTFFDGPRSCRLLFAAKTLEAHPSRIEGLVRHELGHVVDMTTDPKWLDAWAAQRGVRLPPTEERRADAVAEAIWHEPISYDRDDVQLVGAGVSPRPMRLGL